jgi:hypothetical protein
MKTRYSFAANVAVRRGQWTRNAVAGASSVETESVCKLTRDNPNLTANELSCGTTRPGATSMQLAAP